jgi:hypothetical protein
MFHRFTRKLDEIATASTCYVVSAGPNVTSLVLNILQKSFSLTITLARFKRQRLLA